MRWKVATLILIVCCACFSQTFTFKDLPFLAQGTDWPQRVVNNGGPVPSNNSIICMEVLRKQIIADGLDTNIHALCVFVPDSVIAASTPLFVGDGDDPWFNNNFVSGDLNIFGLKGNGVDKNLETGVTPFEIDSDSCGLVAIVTEGNENDAGVLMGHQDTMTERKIALATSQSGVSFFFNGTDGSGDVASLTDWNRVGYIAGFTTNGPNLFNLYFASPVEAHALRVANGSIPDPSFSDSNSITCFSSTITNAPMNFSKSRMSAAAITKGLTATQSSNLWVALRSCRECLGEGMGDPVHDWNRRITEAGGSDISSTTSNAARAFLSQIDSNNLLYSMVTVSPYPTDSLAAVQVPLIWQAGAKVWTNNGFVASDLTTNGLDPNATTGKYFDTSMTNNNMSTRGFSVTSAGLTAIMSSNSAVAMFLGGVRASAAFSAWELGNGDTGVGTIKFSAWRYDGVNGRNFISASIESNSWSGYVSGNRTAEDAIAIYGAASDYPFITLGSGATTQSGVLFSGQQLAENGFNNNGTYSGSSCAISFLAVHAGLTDVQSSNLFLAAYAFRNAIGGGAP